MKTGSSTLHETERSGLVQQCIVALKHAKLSIKYRFKLGLIIYIYFLKEFRLPPFFTPVYF